MSTFAKGLLAVTLLAGGSIALSEATDSNPDTDDPLAARGYHVTSGAAPGYVDDQLCGSCHADLYESYQDVTMAKAFYKPSLEKVIEDFDDNRFFHSKSQRYYEMTIRDERYVVSRYQLDDRGQQINRFETEVDWILGSGSHARVYLYQTEQGELYQLPIAWYSQSETWGMAPGYDQSEHQGVTRLVRRECMFCHNAYPDVPAESDAYAADHRFPFELPEGLGCQRCHGPGAQHAREAMSFPVDFEALAESIVNPATLAAEQRIEVCYGCHMQPVVAVDSVRRFGRSDFSFLPHERIDDYMVQVDAVEKGRTRSERFEINHHPYRLEQSRCFLESQGELTCLTCHDPHRKVSPAERAAHYRAACASCHQVDDCSLEDMRAAADSDNSAPLETNIASDDCVACHMAKRRPEDAVQVVMTDHLIRRQPLWGAGEQEIEEHQTPPSIVDVSLLNPAGRATDDLYRATAAVRAGSGRVATDWLRDLLIAQPIEAIEPYLDLARSQVEQARSEEALVTLELILDRQPSHPWALEWKAIAKSHQGKPKEALALLREVVARYPDRPEGRYNLGRLLTGLGRPREALVELEEAVRLRPPMASAHLARGHALADLGRLEEASQSYRDALAIEPANQSGWQSLARVLRENGDPGGANQILELAPLLSARPQQSTTEHSTTGQD